MITEKLKKIENRYQELEDLLADPKTIDDQTSYQKYAKEFSLLSPLAELVRVLRQTMVQMEELEHLLKEKHEKDFEEMARGELIDLKKKQNLKNHDTPGEVGSHLQKSEDKSENSNFPFQKIVGSLLWITKI